MDGRFRRNAKPCVLCGEEETRDWHYICRSCRNLYEKGKEFAKAESAGPQGTVKIEVAWYPQLSRHHGTVRHIRDQTPGPDQQILTALLALLHATKLEDRGMYRGGSRTAIGLPPDNRDAQPSSKYLVYGNEKTGQHLRTIFQAICDLLATEYADGLRRGKSFVRDLAENKLSVKDLERW